MARIAGVDLPRDKRVEIALTYIYGLGRKRAQEALQYTNIDPDTRVRNLTEDEISRLREYIDKNYKVEGDLRRDVSMNIKRLVEIGCYRGIRHRRGLPGTGANYEKQCPDKKRTQENSRCAQKEIIRGGVKRGQTKNLYPAATPGAKKYRAWCCPY